MAGYSVDVRKSAVKEIAGLPKRYSRAIIDKIRALGAEPRPHGVEKLSRDDKFRIRHGDYRVGYEIADTKKQVTIARVAHRREVYR